MSFVQLSEAKLHLRVDGTDEDALIGLYINAAEQAASKAMDRGVYTDGTALQTAMTAAPAALTAATAAKEAAVTAAEALTDADEKRRPCRPQKTPTWAPGGLPPSIRWHRSQRPDKGRRAADRGAPVRQS